MPAWSQWLESLRRKLFGTPSRRARRGRPRPLLEVLEDRTLPAVNLVSQVLPALSSHTTGGSVNARSVSDDGNYIVFTSNAANLAANDTNNTQDVFLYDRLLDKVTLVSKNAAGTSSGNGGSSSPVISGNGNFIAFTSYASDLVANDSNGGTQDVFVYDRVAGTTTLVSRNSAGTGSGNNDSSSPSISDDGNFIAFTSYATNLTTDADSNGDQDVFVYDRGADTMSLVSKDSAGSGSGNIGSSSAVISGNGNYIAFTSQASNLVTNDSNGTYQDVFVYDRVAGTNALVSRNVGNTGSGNDYSYTPSISDDGTFITYTSQASDLVTNDTNGTYQDVFLFIRPVGLNLLVSKNITGTGSGNSSSFSAVISDDGNFIAFTSQASDLVTNDSNGTSQDVFVYDRGADSVSLVSRNSAGTGSGNSDSSSPVISGNGNFIAFASSASDLVTNDSNGTYQDVFVYDRGAGTNALVSKNAAGTGSGNNYSYTSSISASGSLVAFNSSASDLVAADSNNASDAFFATGGAVSLLTRRDPALALTSLSGNQSSGIAQYQAVSDDGRYVAFTSSASDLVTGDANNAQDVFLYDRVNKTVTLVSHTSGGVSGNGDSSGPVISADGRYVAFLSNATNLTPDADNNGTNQDVFVFDRVTGIVALVSRNSAGTGSGNSASSGPSISDDGRYVAFLSNATNLTPDTDNNGTSPDVFVYDRVAGTNALVSRNVGNTGSGNYDSYSAVISGNGNFIAFISGASNLVTNDSNGYYQDVFVYDRVAGTNALVSRTVGNTGSGNNSSSTPSISDDGNFIAFYSSATNLTSDTDNNGTSQDVFVYDRVAGTNALVSRNSAGTGSGNYSSYSPVISGNGNFIAFTSQATNLVTNDTNYNDSDVFVYDRTANTNRLFSYIPDATRSGNRDSANPAISGNGNFVAFISQATDLVNPDLNNTQDVFLNSIPVVPVSLGPVTPDPRNTPAPVVTVTFSKDVTAASFDAADLTLTLDGVAVTLTGVTVTGSGTTFQIHGLAALTGSDGNYLLTVNAFGIQDLNGEFGIGTVSDTWTMDTTGPTVTQVVPVSPDPRNTAVDVVYVVLSERVDGATFTAADLTLTRDGTPVSLPGGVAVNHLAGSAYEIRGLASVTGSNGTYELTVSMAGVADPLGNGGNGSKSDTWVMDITAPTITSVETVTPDPRNSAISTLDVTFSEAINLATFTFADLTLKRDGGSNLITNAVTIAFVSGTTYRINGLAGLTATDGSYVLTVNGAGIQDSAGNAVANTGTETWSVDATGPTVQSITNVSPDPRATPVPFLDVTLSEAINLATFDFNDVTLTRNGGPNLITNAVTVTLVSGTTYRIADLTGLTGSDGVYELTVTGAGIQDPVGNAGNGSASESWTVDVSSPTVVSVGPVTPDPRNSAVSFVDVVMSEPIDLSTFDFNDLTLTHNSISIPLTNAVTVTHVSGATYRINNLASLTAADGTYDLTVDATTVKDLFNNLGTNSASDTWVVDTVAPNLVSVGPVTPAARATPVFTVDVVFDEAVDLTTFDFNDLTLTRDGGSNLITSGVSVSYVSGTTYRIGNLKDFTSIDGTYLLTVTGSGITDAAGNAVVGTQSTGWFLDGTGPTVTAIAPVTPDPRNVPVSSIDVTFSEAINLATFTSTDLTLTRDGGPNLITNAVTMSLVSGTTYRINNLAGLTGGDGSYELTVDASSIRDGLGNAGTNSLAETWLMNAAAPTVVAVGPVTPDPRNSAVATIDVVLSEVVDLSTFDFNDLTLTRDGGPNLITNAVAVNQLVGSTYQISGLAGLTGINGAYALTVNAVGVTDLQGTTGTGSAADSWVMDTTAPTVVSVVPVSPDPRTTPVTAVTVVLSKPVDLNTFDFNDLSLTLNGGPNLISASAAVSYLGGNSYRIGLPAGLTSSDGTYVLTVNGAGLQDAAGNVGTGSASDTWTVNTVINHPPILTGVPTEATIQEQVPYTFTAGATDPDGPVPPLTFSLVGAPSGAAINPATGQFTWTPTAAQGPGDYTFTVRVSDGGANTDQVVTLHVTERPLLHPAFALTSTQDPYAPRPSASATEAFVKGLYNQVLGREGEASGVAAWVQFLNSGGTREAVINAFLNSREHREHQIEYYYQTFLGRTSVGDPGSVGMVDYLQATQDEATVIAIILGSGEFASHHPGNADFVTQLYRLLLNREPDAGGLAIWTAQLDGGLSRMVAVQAFLHSEEGATWAVESLYVTYLQRPSDAGRAGWIAALQTGATNYSSLSFAFLASAEYAGLAAANVT